MLEQNITWMVSKYAIKICALGYDVDDTTIAADVTYYLLLSAIAFIGVDEYHHMNMRFVVVGALLGVVITIAVIIGSPYLGGFDSMR